MKHKTKNYSIILVFLFLTFIAGCGGGSGNGTIPDANNPIVGTPTNNPIAGTPTIPDPNSPISEIPTMIPDVIEMATPMPTYTPDAKTLELKAQIEKENLGWEPVNNPIAAPLCVNINETDSYQ